MLSRISPRSTYAIITLLCFGLIAFALYLQHTEGLEPCPMCILQRIAFIVSGAVALLGLLFGSAARSRWLPIVLALPVIGGLITAGRHVWIEHFPPESLGCKIQDLDFIMRTVPLADILPKIFRGSADCSAVAWRFLGLSIAEWSLLCFAALLLATLLLLFRSFKRR
ncbi:MAG: disulfide bond formation protein B [Gammaproteobacteria bacterium]|nr:disulfide bond formation protein B [Gammaproteobacteria bacterium]